MASSSNFQCQAPEPFNFANPTEWPKWLKRFERFRLVSGMTAKTEEEQVNGLVYFIGEQAEDVLVTLALSDADSKKYDVIVQAFTDHFIVKRNIVYERAKFNIRGQDIGEPVDDFIRALHLLAERCEYGTLKEDLIRDRIVVGVRDKALSEKMQLDQRLTLSQATTMARQSEAIRNQQDVVRPGNKQGDLQLAPVGSQTKGFKKRFDRRPWVGGSTVGGDIPKKLSSGLPKGERIGQSCFKCGKERHSRMQCPANTAECFKCRKRGHFARFCKTGINTVCQENSEFLGAIDTPKGHQVPRWMVDTSVGGKAVMFKIDTGADVTVIPASVYFGNFSEVSLKAADKLLEGPSSQPLGTLGMFRETIRSGERSVQTNIYVVRGLKTALLSRADSERLQLVCRGNSVAPVQEKLMTATQAQANFSQLFTGLGHIKDSLYKIRLRDGAVPERLDSARRVPIPLLPKIRKKLDEMVLMSVIEPVHEPSDWCAGMVVQRKKDGDVRICVDLRTLNKSVQREFHPMPVTEHLLGQIKFGRYFSKLDANSGFWQHDLDEESQILTTFITPFGRYKFKRLPFGITSAPEFFQREMSRILEGIPGVICNMDDILIFGATIEEHNARLLEVLKRLWAANVTLNLSKCDIGVTSVRFVDHILDAKGIRPDEEKIRAIVEMPRPQSITELRSFLGMVNYLGKFVQDLSQTLRPLHALLEQKTLKQWGEPQETCFKQIKSLLVQAPTLAYYNPDLPTKVSADASSYGLGGILRQCQEDGSWKPVAYASRTLSETERNYAQIEKEGLSLVWACERFRDFIVGKAVTLETDHKPLVAVFQTKRLDDLSPRLLRMRLRLLRFDYVIEHVAGKAMGAADTLSRQPLAATDVEVDTELEEELTAFVNTIITNLPISDTCLLEVRNSQESDESCRLLRQYVLKGWPNKRKLPASCQIFWQYRDAITLHQGVLLFGQRLVIPITLRADMLDKLHQGHLGIVKCRERARMSVWWPGISGDIAKLVTRCTRCIEERKNRCEPLLPTEFPEYPWKKVGTDLFFVKGKWYLLVTDYYSRYPEIALLTTLTSANVINHLKSIFSRHGTPEEVFSDNGGQFSKVTDSNFHKFATEWGFRHVTSSPRYAQSNGFVEAGVKIVKRCLIKDDDAYRALQSYRATPLENGYSPSELLMGRRLRTALPMLSTHYKPRVPDQRALRQKESQRILQQKLRFDNRHKAAPLQPLKSGNPVWIVDRREWGTVQRKSDEPRSYIVKSTNGERELRRNRFHLIPSSSEETDSNTQGSDSKRQSPKLEVLPKTDSDAQPTATTSGTTPVRTTRSGRVIKTPDRLVMKW